MAKLELAISPADILSVSSVFDVYQLIILEQPHIFLNVLRFDFQSRNRISPQRG
jgi:hypothetical protein